jgi:glycolate oxidase FAD binding subunit
MSVETLHPHTVADVAEALRGASADTTTVAIVGGHTHGGGSVGADAELWTTQLDRVVAYEPAEMLIAVEAGIRLGPLRALLRGSGQEWPVDADDQATVGGVIATAASSPRRLRTGMVRDSVVELGLVTGDGRILRSGARTVKNVSGYDLHRLATGSGGTLGCITHAALKLRPLPAAAATVVAAADPVTGVALLDAAPLVAGVAVMPGRVEVRLEGWADEVRDLRAAVERAARTLGIGIEDAGDDTWPSGWRTGPGPDAVVPPSRIPELVSRFEGWVGLLGVGVVRFDGGVDRDALRRRAEELGGSVLTMRGPLDEPDGPRREIETRLRRAFDPGGVLVGGLG